MISKYVFLAGIPAKEVRDTFFLTFLVLPKRLFQNNREIPF